MLRILFGLIVLALLASPATAARSKADVAAAGCLTLSEARAAYKKAELRYRLISGAQCWYAPGHPPATKPDKIKVADDTTVVQEALCGGPCPRFDLTDKVYTALCGGPCPDFRRMKQPEVALNR